MPTIFFLSTYYTHHIIGGVEQYPSLYNCDPYWIDYIVSPKKRVQRNCLDEEINKIRDALLAPRLLILTPIQATTNKHPQQPGTLLVLYYRRYDQKG